MKLYQDLSLLLQEVEKQDVKTALFAGIDTSARVEQYKSMLQKVELSEEEQANMQPTLDRIEVESQINEYIESAGIAYQSIHHIREVKNFPEWLKFDKTTEADYAEFDTEIEKDSTLQERTEKFLGHPFAEYKQALIDWQDAKKRETLKKESAEKVRQAIDLRFLLAGELRAYGYSTAAIHTLLGVTIDELEQA